MARFVPNPIAELLQPLLRLEGAIEKLSGELRPVHTLPSVHRELADVNVALAGIHETLRGLREDMAHLSGVLAPEPSPTAAAPSSRARRSRSAD